MRANAMGFDLSGEGVSVASFAARRPRAGEAPPRRRRRRRRVPWRRIPMRSRRHVPAQRDGRPGRGRCKGLVGGRQEDEDDGCVYRYEVRCRAHTSALS